ncbi:MAG: indole-3-glycerol phosphate synthase TrpC [Pseudomonadales bacterium]
MSTPTILDRILAEKRLHIDRQREAFPIDLEKIERSDKPRGFLRALRARNQDGSAAVIAEIKKGSPSKGIIRRDYDVAQIAQSYDVHGAACISCLTDAPFFHGSDSDLELARASAACPVLRKDFIVDDYQIYESYALGADCVLLIVAALTDDKLRNLYSLAQSLGLDVLVEVHNREECERALVLQPSLLGINNRNLHDFSVSIDNTIELLPIVPQDTLVVSESGIHSRSDVSILRTAGVGAFLVGEAFMRHPNPGEKLSELFG